METLEIIQECNNITFAMGKSVLAKAKTQFDDGLQKNIQKKRRSIEAQRFSCITENCISQVEIAATVDALLRLNHVSSVVDKKLSHALTEHQVLVERLETQEGLKQESDGDEARRRAGAQLEKDIKKSVRDLLRLVQANPDAFFGLRAELDLDVDEGESILISDLKKFHSYMLEMLQNGMDKKRQLVLCKQVSSPLAHNMKYTVSLEEEVTKAMKETDAMISHKNDEIRSLQSSLQGEKTQEGAMAILLDKLSQSPSNTSKVKQSSTQQDQIDQMKIQLDSLILENRPTERVLKEKCDKVKTEVDHLIQHFDEKMEGIQADLESTETDNGRLEEDLRRMEKLISLLEVECNQIKEKRQLAEETRKEEMRIQELKTKASILVQAWWRGYTTRKALKKKGKGKKGKKGKGKKGK